MNEADKLRNSLTEPKGNYKLYNPYLLDAYTSLNPASFSKLAMVLFNGILFNKRYHKQESNMYSEAEDKRIYNSTMLTPEFILMQSNPSKYLIDKMDLQQDIGNLVKRLHEMDELNIFYMWRTGYPHVYMFFVERDIGLWKSFNTKGVVTPKTMLKIIRWDNQIVECMKGMLQKEGQHVDKKDVENSFGLFVNKMIGKMQAKVAAKLSLWKGVGDLCDYVNALTTELRAMEPYEGLEQDEGFVNRVPASIRMKLLPKVKEKNMNLFDVDVSEAIAPKEKNLVTIKKSRKKSLLKEMEVEGVYAETSTYTEETDPFKNCNEFIYFYRDMIKSLRKAVRFSDVSTERKDATEVLDLMIENKRDNKRFLKGWITYYVNTYLPPHLPHDESKTTMSTFRKTFTEFNMRYVELV